MDNNLGNLETTVSGKIKQVRNKDGVYYTNIISPAVDAYSNPPIVQIRSRKSVGRIGDEVNDLLCRVSGFERRFSYMDKQTGEQLRGGKVDMILELIEH